MKKKINTRKEKLQLNEREVCVCVCVVMQVFVFVRDGSHLYFCKRFSLMCGQRVNNKKKV